MKIINGFLLAWLSGRHGSIVIQIAICMTWPIKILGSFLCRVVVVMWLLAVQLVHNFTSWNHHCSSGRSRHSMKKYQSNIFNCNVSFFLFLIRLSAATETLPFIRRFIWYSIPFYKYVYPCFLIKAGVSKAKVKLIWQIWEIIICQMWQVVKRQINVCRKFDQELHFPHNIYM